MNHRSAAPLGPPPDCVVPSSSSSLRCGPHLCEARGGASNTMKPALQTASPQLDLAL